MKQPLLQNPSQSIGGMFMDNHSNLTELTKMKLEADNGREGPLKGFDCELCLNKGLIYKADENETIYAVRCKCLDIRKTMQNAEKSGLGNYINKTLDDFKTAEEWQKGIYGKAVKYLSDQGNAWFIITGQSGAGKTLICSIIANDFLFNQRKQVVYLTWTDFIGKIKRNLMSEKALEADTVINRAKSAEILFIDEFLKTHSEADLKYVVEIINYRYTKQLKTIITSELSADEFLKIDEASFGRMFEMTNSGKYYIQILKDRNKNQRLKIVNA